MGWMRPEGLRCTKIYCAKKMRAFLSKFFQPGIFWPADEIATSAARFVEKKLAHVRVGNILLHHALGIKERSVDRDSVLHDAEITVALVIKHRNDHAIQFRVERFRVGFVIGDQIGRGTACFADGPAGYAFDVT